MPKYFCEYCGIYLTHSSPLGRKQHAKGKKHISNKIEYYSQFLYEYQNNAMNAPKTSQAAEIQNSRKIQNLITPSGMPGNPISLTQNQIGNSSINEASVARNDAAQQNGDHNSLKNTSEYLQSMQKLQIQNSKKMQLQNIHSLQSNEDYGKSNRSSVDIEDGRNKIEK